MMESGKEEEIIDLTEVVEEGSPFSRQEERAETQSRDREEKKDPGFGAGKEFLIPPAENRAAEEEPWIADPMAAESIRRMVRERISPELDQLKAEIAAFQAQREALSRKVEEWFSAEGRKVLEQNAREAIPQIAREALEPEVQKCREEIGKARTQVEELSRRVALWLEDEGKSILEKTAREIFPQIAQETLCEEINKLKKEIETEESE